MRTRESRVVFLWMPYASSIHSHRHSASSACFPVHSTQLLGNRHNFCDRYVRISSSNQHLCPGARGQHRDLPWLQPELAHGRSAKILVFYFSHSLHTVLFTSFIPKKPSESNKNSTLIPTMTQSPHPFSLCQERCILVNNKSSLAGINSNIINSKICVAHAHTRKESS